MGELWDEYDLAAFQRGYEEAADFCSEGEDFADGTGWHPDTMRQFDADCLEFARDNVEDLVASGLSADQAGADFWFTRERHGTGYWDEGYRESAAANAALARLTDAAHAYGEVGLYVGDDGWIYAS